MRPLRGERTISVAKCPKQDLNLRWSGFKPPVSSAGLLGLMSKRGVGRGFNPPYTAFQNGLARFPFSPEGPVAQGSDVQHRFTKQWRLKPLFLVDPTLASVLRESFEIITRLGVIFF